SWWWDCRTYWPKAHSGRWCRWCLGRCSCSACCFSAAASSASCSTTSSARSEGSPNLRGAARESWVQAQPGNSFAWSARDRLFLAELLGCPHYGRVQPGSAFTGVGDQLPAHARLPELPEVVE